MGVVVGAESIMYALHNDHVQPSFFCPGSLFYIISAQPLSLSLKVSPPFFLFPLFFPPLSLMSTIPSCTIRLTDFHTQVRERVASAFLCLSWIDYINISSIICTYYCKWQVCILLYGCVIFCCVNTLLSKKKKQPFFNYSPALVSHLLKGMWVGPANKNSRKEAVSAQTVQLIRTSMALQSFECCRSRALITNLFWATFSPLDTHFLPTSVSDLAPSD